MVERVESLSTHLYDPIMLGVVLFFKTETAKTVTMLFTVYFYDSTLSLWGSFPGWIFDSQYYTGDTIQFRYKFTGTIASFGPIPITFSGICEAKRRCLCFSFTLTAACWQKSSVVVDRHLPLFHSIDSFKDHCWRGKRCWRIYCHLAQSEIVLQ